MILQLDTTISVHKALHPLPDSVVSAFNDLQKAASSIHASTYVRKEFIFSLINDCCLLQSKLYNTKSFFKTQDWINKYGYYHKRFPDRADKVITVFMIKTYGDRHHKGTLAEKDMALADDLVRYLRILIPELWERFLEDLYLPLDNRTQCPYANIGPQERGYVFNQKTKRKCKEDEGCAVSQLFRGKGQKERALKLLPILQSMPDKKPTKKTKELKDIQDFIERFYEAGETNACYEMCPQKIGDLVIAMETLPDRTLVTTNAKEYDVICPAIKQLYRVLSLSPTTTS